MTERLLESFKQNIDQLSLVPHEGGRFEISVDGEQIYSKLATGEFPEHDRIVAELEKRRG